MPQFNFNTLTLTNFLDSLLTQIPVSSSFNFLIIGNTLIIPLGSNPKTVLSTKIAKKDLATSELSLTASITQDGGTVISQRAGHQIRVSTKISLTFFKELFSLENVNLQISAVGLLDFALSFAYDNFLNTDCILVDQTGIRGLGEKRLVCQDFNSTYDPNDADNLVLDLLLYFEEPKTAAPPAVYEVDENAINSILA